MNIIIFTVIYILIVLGELYLIKQYVEKNQNDKLLLDKKDKKKKNSFICNELKKRIDKLEKMSFSDWIEYNIENDIDYEGEKLNLNIFEKLKNSDNFIIRASRYTDYLDMNIRLEQDLIGEKSSYYSNEERLMNNTPADMYNISEWDDGCSRYSYIWAKSPDDPSPVIRQSIGKVFKKVENNVLITGVISNGYPILEIAEKSSYYFKDITNYFLVILYVFIYIIVVVTYYITNGNLYESSILLLILNFYSTTSLFSRDLVSSAKYEEHLTNNLNSSILGISFLVAANIFVIQSLKNEKIYKWLYNETAFLFCCSLIALMISMFKTTDFKNTTDVKTHRIQNQIFFNLSIILNIFIFLNYFVYISNEKIVSVLPNTVKNFLSFFNKQKGKKA
jgi:hypothetical protein